MSSFFHDIYLVKALKAVSLFGRDFWYRRNQQTKALYIIVLKVYFNISTLVISLISINYFDHFDMFCGHWAAWRCSLALIHINTLFTWRCGFKAAGGKLVFTSWEPYFISLEQALQALALISCLGYKFTLNEALTPSMCRYKDTAYLLKTDNMKHIFLFCCCKTEQT